MGKGNESGPPVLELVLVGGLLLMGVHALVTQRRPEEPVPVEALEPVDADQVRTDPVTDGPVEPEPVAAPVEVPVAPPAAFAGRLERTEARVLVKPELEREAAAAVAEHGTQIKLLTELEGGEG